MRRDRRDLVVATCLIVSAGLLFTAGCAKSADTAKEAQEKMMYHCPMHPTYISDKPGDCPICGMKLVKMETKHKIKPPSPEKNAAPLQPAKEKTLEEVCIEHKCTMKNCSMGVKADMKPGERLLCPICGEVISTANGRVVEISKQSQAMLPPAAVGSSVVISPEKQQLIGLRTEPVKKMALSKVVRASGKIAYDPALVVTQEEYIQAIRNEANVKDSPLPDVVERAKAMTAAAKNKLKLAGMNDNQINKLADTLRAQTNLYLPGKGEDVWAYISIYEYEIGLVHPGDNVDVEAVAYPGETFAGKVVSVNPVLDPATRTNQVRVEVANKENKLKPEMFINANIKVDLGERLAVPESAVLNSGLRTIVYILKSEAELESVEVKLGQKAEGFYEVLGGLNEGDLVVTSGNFLVDSESKLRSLGN